jgi:hypothetical protein
MSKQSHYQKKMRAARKCIICGDTAAVKNGKTQSRCERHRKLKAQQNRAYRARRKAAMDPEF